MFYILYQVTNLINCKIYIGVHRTKNLEDGYMGSGKAIKQAIKKYGKENFKKEVLEFFEDEIKMYQREKEVINEDFLKRKDVYNLTNGGTGGFYYINSSGKALRTGAVLSEETKRKISEKKMGHPTSEKTRKKLSDSNAMKHNPVAKQNLIKALTGKKKSEEHKKNLSEAIKLWHLKRKNAAMVFNG